jgi:ketosteroid isomerase-like protein
MDKRLQEMVDHHDIRKLLAVYCHACDRGDASLMASLYTDDDSFDDHGHVKASGPEYARIMTGLVAERTVAASHILGQSLIAVDGDTARAETCFVAFFRLPGSSGGNDKLNQLMGRFVDRLKRIDGQWKLHRRTCVRDTSLSLTIDEDAYTSFGFVEATRDRDDAGAKLIGLAHGALSNPAARGA